MFDADRPITIPTQDKLNRTQFATYLARCLLDHHDPESLVVGLYGGFGVGKTSLLNLVVNELNFAASNMADDEKPVILNFSPWSYSGQGQLIDSFYRRLSSAIRNAAYVENADEIILQLERYASFFTQKPLPAPLRPQRSWLSRLFRRTPTSYDAWGEGRDPTQVKARLNELLKQQKHKLIIVIDNISRLYPDEIKLIFQIVKSMADYANTAYLLAFDKEQVKRALKTLNYSHSDAFIEKVVQLSFTVPPILPQNLEAIFADRLASVIKTIPEGTWKNQYWADIYYNSLKYFFENCRDITRYVNHLQFSYQRVRDIVNPMDFFAISAIEVFLPEVYAGIRDNKDLFTDLLDNVYILTDEQVKKDRIRCDEIIARNERISADKLVNLLCHLFPRIRHLYQPNVSFYHSDAIARKLRHICSPDLFDAYFRLSMQAAQIPEKEFQTMLALTNDPVIFDHTLTRLNQDERIINFLDQLDEATSQHAIPMLPKNIEAIIHALLDDGDLFPIGISGPLSLDTPTRIHRIIHHLLQHLPSNEERFLILQNAIANAQKSIYISIHELRQQALQHHKDEDSYLPHEFRDLSSEQLALLQKLTVSRIAHWADDGRLQDHPQLLSILNAWLSWSNGQACKQFVEKMTHSDRGLIAFLLATLKRPIDEAMTLYEKKPSWHAALPHIEAFIPVANLEPHARALFEDPYFEKLREREQLALMIFLDLVDSPALKKIEKTTI